jgi:outer membrane protein assembly factor BamB
MYQFERAVFSSVAIASNLLVVGTVDGKLAAFSLTEGKPAWVFQTPEAATAAAAYTAEQKRLQRDSLNRDRAFYDNMVFRANNQLTDSFMSSPVLADGVIFVGSVDGNVYALK